MKKFLTLLSIAAALLAVSCAKEQKDPSVGKATVTFTVDAGQITTRAVSGTRGDATRLRVGVYHKNGTEYKYLSALAQSREVTSWPTTVSLELAKNETYKLVFWADEGTDAYAINWENGTVTEPTTTIAGNIVNRDAYYKLVELTTTGAASGEAITLVRPLAQVNVGTSDLASYKAAAAYTGKVETKVVISGVAPGLNLLTGAATSGETKTLTFSYANNLDATLVSDSKNYDYMALNYILCPADATLTAAVSLRKENVTTETINDFTVSYMPVKQNYRTNIVGKLLTGTVYYTVDVDTNFINDLNKPIGPTFSSLADLNTYLGTLKEGTSDGDNGDVTPEQVVLTAMGAVTGTPKIVLPKIHGDVDIRLVFPYAGTLEVVYADGATDAQKPANIYFYAQKLDNLTATVPASHFELLSGSVVTNKAIVSTNTTTFVIQHGAKVGTAEIQKGNANIAGEVATLNVPTGATADGTNPVQVFLEKVSSVEKIELAAKTDVVVEQPKDQITKDETERKVAVYVKEGADNSTAKAQNGGVIYVKAEVPCTVTADGTSEAEDGTPVSSTVIIEPSAAGSSVNATNGGAIDLTANGNCSASSDGKAEGEGGDPDTPSTITVTSVKDDNVIIDSNTSDGGTINTTTETEGAVKYYVAQIVGGEKYESLYDAVAAAESGATVEMINNSTETKGFTLTKSLTIDLRDFKVIYDSSEGTAQFPNTRAIKVGGSDAISVTIENGTIVVQDNIYGPFRFENSNADIVLNDLVLNNGMAYGLGIKLVSAKSLAMEGCSVTSVIGGGLEQNYACPVTISDCEFDQTELDTQHPWISSAVSVCYNGVINVDSGSYSGYTAAFVFSSGGTININGGTFVGRDAAINVENNTWEPGYAASSVVNVTGGTFTGALKVSGWGEAGTSPVSALNISGGTFTAKPGDLFHTNPGTISITGGTFSEDPSAYVDLNDYKVEENAGMYTVSPIPVFHITNEEELQQAFDEGHVKMLLENDIDVENPHTLTLNSGKTANLIMPYCINNSSNLSFVINGNLNITGCGEIWNGENLTVSGTGNIDIASTISGSDFSYEGFFDNSKAMVMENVTITSDVVPFTAIANSSNGTLSMTNVKMYIEDRGIFSNGGGNVTLNSVDFECFYRACFRSQFSENAEVTVTDSKLLSHSYYWNEYNGKVGGAYNQTFQMIGGGHATITNTEIGGVHGAISISKSDNVPSSATINSGRFYTFNPEAPTVKEQVYGAIYLYYSSVIINGGEFIAGGGYPSLRFYGGNAEINGGKFGVGSYNMTPIEYLDAYTLSVKGGWFAKKIEDKYLANGYQWVESGDATYPWAVEQIQ